MKGLLARAERLERQAEASSDEELYIVARDKDGLYQYKGELLTQEQFAERWQGEPAYPVIILDC